MCVALNLAEKSWSIKSIAVGFEKEDIEWQVEVDERIEKKCLKFG